MDQSAGLRAFEDAIVAEYLPQTQVEQELVHRLASLFWRLRRATSIETGLLRMQSEILHAFRSSRQNAAKPSAGEGASQALAGTGPEFRQDVVPGANGEHELHPQGGRPRAANASRDIAISFLRLANLDNEIVDRLSRYEALLWRHTVCPANLQTPVRTRPYGAPKIGFVSQQAAGLG